MKLKTILFIGAGILVAFGVYFNWDKIKGGKTNVKETPPNIPPSPVDTIIKEEYVVVLPEDTTTVAVRNFKKGLRDAGLNEQHICPCYQGLQLWRGNVDFDPDTDPPTSGGNSGFAISRNISILQDESPELPDIPQTQPQPPKGSLVKIAIVDTGVDTLNNSLSNYLYRNPLQSFLCNSTTREGIRGMNMLYLNHNREQNSPEPQDEDNHGTFINGIIAGMASYPPYNNKGSQLKVKLKLLNVKIGQNRNIGGSLLNALCGMHYAINKQSDIVNVSWHVRPDEQNTNTVAGTFTHVLDRMRANKSNIMLVASAGNKGETNLITWPSSFSRPITLQSRHIDYPVDYSNIVVSVGAWDMVNRRISTFSNRGSTIDIYAPGENIRSLDLGNQERMGHGTSYAVPFVVRRLAENIGTSTARNNGDFKNMFIQNYSTQVNINNQNVRVLNMQ